MLKLSLQKNKRLLAYLLIIALLIINIGFFNIGINKVKAQNNDQSIEDAIYWIFGKSMNADEYDEFIMQVDKASKIQTKEREEKKEREILERIVEAEAGGEDIKGRILVANVILNRVKSKKYPNTIEGVVFQKVAGKVQFSPILDKRYFLVKVSKTTKSAVDKALNGEDYSDGALYFMARKYASKNNAKWFDNKLQYLFKHGCHEFYKDR